MTSVGDNNFILRAELRSMEAQLDDLDARIDDLLPDAEFDDLLDIDVLMDEYSRVRKERNQWLMARMPRGIGAIHQQDIEQFAKEFLGD